MELDGMSPLWSGGLWSCNHDSSVLRVAFQVNAWVGDVELGGELGGGCRLGVVFEGSVVCDGSVGGDGG
eukprot:6630152-Alexandrium_andersonii.AAC.1